MRPAAFFAGKCRRGDQGRCSGHVQEGNTVPEGVLKVRDLTQGCLQARGIPHDTNVACHCFAQLCHRVGIGRCAAFVKADVKFRRRVLGDRCRDVFSANAGENQRFKQAVRGQTIGTVQSGRRRFSADPKTA